MFSGQTKEPPLFYDEINHGDHIVLFFHGFPFDRTMWLEAGSCLKSPCRLIFPDMRGFGKTTLPVSRTTSMLQFANDAANLIHYIDDHVTNDNTSKITLCGLSMGGYVALHFVKYFSDHFKGRLAGLILCDTKSQADSEAAAQNRRNRADSLPEKGLATLADAMIPNLFAPQTGENPRQNVREMIMRQPIPGVAAADRGMADRPDMTEWLPDFTLPTLVLCGEQDMISPVEEIKCMSEQLPNSRFIAIPNAGHLPPIESPKNFSRAVENFLAETGGELPTEISNHS